MKKVLVLVLVLAMATAANALTVDIQHDGSSSVTATAGDTITVTIKADTAADSYALSLGSTTTSTAGDATATALGTLTAGFDSINNAGTLRNGMTNYQGARYILIDRINGSVLLESPSVAAGTTLYSFDLKIPDLASNGDTFTVDAAVGFGVFSPPPAGYGHQVNGLNPDTTNLLLITVPEPMTIALLGLGGLFLRRRK
jgi:hypothetical protein